VIAPSIANHGGRIVKLIGDGILAEFDSVVEAVQCAAEIQYDIAARKLSIEIYNSLAATKPGSSRDRKFDCEQQCQCEHRRGRVLHLAGNQLGKRISDEAKADPVAIE
jgi:hypothetical protein